MTYCYTTDSIQANKRDVFRMRIFSRQITYKAIKKNCPDILDFARAYGFKSGEQLAAYPSVKFCRSAFCGRKCYYIDIDGVKYIWCEQEDVNGEEPKKANRQRTC
jgi:hypothetical protein